MDTPSDQQLPDELRDRDMGHFSYCISHLSRHCPFLDVHKKSGRRFDKDTS